MHGNILSVKFALSSEQQLLISQLRKLVRLHRSWGFGLTCVQPVAASAVVVQRFQRETWAGQAAHAADNRAAAPAADNGRASWFCRMQVLELESQKQDFDVIETNLDNTMRNLLQQVHGTEKLDDEVSPGSSLQRL